MMYETYLSFCEDTDKSPAPKDSNEFQNWASEQAQIWFDEDLGEIQRFKAYNTDLIITGTLGLWSGRKEIVPVEACSVYDAIMRCCKNCDDCVVEYDNGYIKIKANHHDGTNSFVVRPVDKRKKLPYLYA